MINSNQKITTFLMFNGKAKEAIEFYISVFNQSEINTIHYQENGTVLHASFTLKGQMFMAIDNSNKDNHPFTPAMSLFVTFDTEKEIDEVFEQLSQDGKILMPLAALPFSKKFGWIEDRFGVSWQLNLTKSE